MGGAESSPSGRFGVLLKRYRTAAGLTQRELATHTDLSVAAIRDLEQGRSRTPRARSVRVLAEVLGLTPDQLAALQGAIAGPAEAVGPAEPVVSADLGEGQPPPQDDILSLGLLGPLVVHLGAAPVRLAGQQRVLLGRLALTPNSPVRRDDLVDLLWGQQVPPSAVNLLHTYVSRLRRALEPRRRPRGPSAALALVPGGYQLNIGEDQLDLLRFRKLVARARTEGGGPERALALLDEALNLWRGEPLADVDDLRGDPRVVALTEDQVSAVIRHARLAEQLARQELSLPRLREVADRYPLHEPLHARLIAALAATGRQAAALTAYDEIRRRLADELGMDPGAELVEAYDGVLRQRWSSRVVVQPSDRSPVPFQTPAPPVDFTGRHEHLRQVEQALRRDPQAPAPEAMAVCAISGVPGVGKTTLALRAAQVLRRGFPDGQLYLDLQGPGARPVTPLEALGRFLRALGVEGRGIPAEETECAGLYRSLLAERRMLVVLDNARDAAQVRPLLPGSGGCAALVTSRRRLADLAGATMVDLGLFSPAEALDLLAAVAGPARVAADPAAAAGLTAACGLLPIALRVAGGRLASRPTWTVSGMVERLDDQRRRLDELKLGDIAVGASFELSYRDLAPRAARTFRMLAAVPGLGFTLPAAAAVLDEDEAAVDEELGELVDANLLQVSAEGRYGYHDLVRLYAVSRAEAEDDDRARSAAVQRLMDWCLARTADAVRLVYPEMVRLPLATPHDAVFTDDTAAMAWLDAELPGLVLAVEYAAVHGPRERAWQLTDQLRGYFFVRRDAVSWLATGRAGLAAATAAEDPTGQAAMRQTLGQAYWSVGRHHEALSEYETAVSLAERSGWLAGAAYLLHNIGLVQAELGRLPEAEASYRRALEISAVNGFDHVRAVTLNDLGTLCHERGRLTDAAEYFTEAMTVNERRSHRKSATVNRANLGMVLRQLGRFDEAREHLEAVLGSYRQDGSHYGQMAVLDELSQLYTQVEQHPAAVATARQALGLARAAQNRRGEAALLTTLGEALLAAGAVAEARRCLVESFQLASEHSYRYFEIRAQIGLARACLVAGEAGAAVDYASRGLSAARAGGYGALETEAKVTLAEAYLADGRAADVAARSAGHEESFPR